MKRTIVTILFTALTWTTSFSGKSKDIDRHIPIQLSNTIELRGFSGSKIDFKSWDKNDVYVKLKIEVESSSENYEDDYIKNVDLETKQSGESIIITFKQPSMSGRNGFSWSNLFKLKFTTYNSIEVTGEIFIPQKNTLFMEAKYSEVSLENMLGDLSLSGNGSTIRLKNCSSIRNIENDYGTTSIEQSGGSLHLKGAGSKVSVEKFDGSVDINADYSTTQLREITKDAVVKSKSSASITAEHIGQNLSIDADYSTLKINDIKGFVDIQDQSGNIRVKSAAGVRVIAPYSHIDISDVSGKSKKPLRIENTSGRIVLENIIGDVSIEGPYTPMDLTTIRGNLEVETKSTQVNITDLVGNLKATSEYTAFDFVNITADDIVLTDKSSQVSIEVKNMPSRIDIRNEYGNVSLRLPKEYSAEANLKVAYGTIKCNMPMNVEQLGSSAYFVGKFGDNPKNSLKVQTSSGDIALKFQ